MQIPNEEEIKAAKKSIEALVLLLPQHCRGVKNFASGIPGIYANVGPNKEIKIFYSQENLTPEYFF